MAGAHVFPGGILEDGDSDPRWRDIVPSGKEIDAGELAWRLAGVREVFEECGLLISRPPLSSSPPEAKKWRERSAQDSTHFLRMFTDRESDDNAGLRHHIPDTEALVPWAHWVTPLEEKWRYDTRFYLSVLPQPYDHAQTDAREVTHLDWFAPTEALRAFDEGTISLPPPTWFMLKELTNYPSLASLREATTRGRDLTPVQPSLVPTDEGLVIAMSGDRLHWASRGSVAARGFNRMLAEAGPGRQSYALIVDPNPPLSASL
ncbi:nucleoside diphosphate, putative [Acanthamoeba castellanii str. Neff]|uniref:Nucleoside diphosphate, putative n=1 Tax=Acanthamoeba castellanii (strain ATCC 30010 / Neff) TaxID=1257118 RepID=L8GNB6_ACACF|nr:nucleoside diphosphate, putative [Acanthamoeba castellanii str. Neff]ELR14319.1 nucleoside diphosphate, putative [Acanthamoeba castellanii str. Neff]